MTRLLLLSSDTGEGHNSAAAAIRDAAAAAGLDASIRKPLEESTPVNRLLGNLYNTLLRCRPQSMHWYLRFIDRTRPNERDIFYSRVRNYIGQFIESEKPDILLSVHPMLNHFIQRYIKEKGCLIPCYAFLTDPFPPFWRGWASPFIDRYFVPTDEALRALTAAGIPGRRIERVRMPVRQGFRPSTTIDIQRVRKELNLDSAGIILINGGARGGGPLYRIYQTIRASAPNSNILAVCGRNEDLRGRIERLQDSRTRAFGFLEDLHRYVAVSDLVVTKPGALSTYEALACRVPVLLTGIHGLMPQESGFFHAAERYNFGFAAATFEELERIIRSGPGEWNRKREQIAQFYEYNSGEELIERIHFADVRA